MRLGHGFLRCRGRVYVPGVKLRTPTVLRTRFQRSRASRDHYDSPIGRDGDILLRGSHRRLDKVFRIGGAQAVAALASARNPFLTG